MQLWRLRSSKICSRQDGEPGELIFSEFQSKSEGLKSRKANDLSSLGVQVKRHEKGNVPAQGKSGREWVLPYSALLFYLGLQGKGWVPSTLRRAISFTQSIDLNINLLQKYSHRCLIIFNQIAGQPVAQSSWQINLTIASPSLDIHTHLKL